MVNINQLLHPRFTAKKLIRILLPAFLVAFSLNFVGISPAFAATPQYVEDQCLSTLAFLGTPVLNSSRSYGETYNECPVKATIYQSITVNSGCPGLGNGTGTIKTFVQEFTINAGCVVCKYINGVLVDQTYPDFVLMERVSATATFVYHNTLVRATSNIATDSITVTNTGRYAPPCPSTK